MTASEIMRQAVLLAMREHRFCTETDIAQFLHDELNAMVKDKLLWRPEVDFDDPDPDQIGLTPKGRETASEIAFLHEKMTAMVAGRKLS